MKQKYNVQLLQVGGPTFNAFVHRIATQAAIAGAKAAIKMMKEQDKKRRKTK